MASSQAAARSSARHASASARTTPARRCTRTQTQAPSPRQHHRHRRRSCSSPPSPTATQVFYFTAGPGTPEPAPSASPSARRRRPERRRPRPGSRRGPHLDRRADAQRHVTLGISLDGAAAPQAVSGFVADVQDGYYVGKTCHRLAQRRELLVPAVRLPRRHRRRRPRLLATDRSRTPPPTASTRRAPSRWRAPATTPTATATSSSSSRPTPRCPTDSAGGYTVVGTVTSGLDSLITQHHLRRASTRRPPMRAVPGAPRDPDHHHAAVDAGAIGWHAVRREAAGRRQRWETSGDERSGPLGPRRRDGTVYVREAEGERAVGQYPDATPEEALAYFERKFTELAGQVSLLEQRVRGGAPAADVAKAVTALTDRRSPTRTPSATSRRSRERLEKLGGRPSASSPRSSRPRRKAGGRGRARRARGARRRGRDARRPGPGQGAVEAGHRPARRALRALADAPAGRPAPPQEREQRALEAVPRRPHHHRDRTARRSSPSSTPCTATRAPASRSSSRRPRRSPTKGADGIPDYRTLLDDWKLAGRAGKKVDDALWAQFKAAGDVLYARQGRGRRGRERRVRGEPRGQARAARRGRAAADRDRPRRPRTRPSLGIQRRWDEIGKVPRDAGPT